MTKITTLLFALTIQVAASANTNDSLRHCYQQLDIAKSSIQTLKTENRELKAKICTLNKTFDAQKTETDSLKGELTAAKMTSLLLLIVLMSIFQILVLNFKQVHILSIKRFVKITNGSMDYHCDCTDFHHTCIHIGKSNSET